jgi:hypothetical protein
VRGQIGATLTWFAGFLVIFFVMSLFAVGTVFIAAQRTISGGLADDSIHGGLGPYPAIRSSLISNLKGEVEYDGEINVRDLVKKSVDPYIKLGLPDVNNAYLSDVRNTEKLLKLGILEREGDGFVNKEEEKTVILQEVFGDGCGDYFLKVPYGFIYRLDGKEKFSRKMPWQSGGFSTLGYIGPIKLSFSHMGKIIILEYYEMEGCNE